MTPTTPDNSNGSITPSGGTNNLSASLGNNGSTGMQGETGVSGTTGTGSRGGTSGMSAGAGSSGGTDDFGTTTTGSTGTSGTRSHLGAAGSRLAQAARDAGTTLRGAASAAGEELKIGGKAVKADLADGALEGIAAAEQAAEVARQQMDVLMDKGRDLMDSAAEMIRARPLASFGVAFAAGWLIAKMARGGSDR